MVPLMLPSAISLLYAEAPDKAFVDRIRLLDRCEASIGSSDRIFVPFSILEKEKEDTMSKLL